MLSKFSQILNLARAVSAGKLRVATIPVFIGIPTSNLNLLI
eukprot:SAG31_NODE_5804_length_2322_cov_2.267656_4_plen_41_part_00